MIRQPSPTREPIARTGRRHRYVAMVRREAAGFECLIVDVGGDGGGWQEASEVSWGEAFSTALRVTRDQAHCAFGAPIEIEAVDYVVGGRR